MFWFHIESECMDLITFGLYMQSNALTRTQSSELFVLFFLPTTSDVNRKKKVRINVEMHYAMVDCRRNRLELYIS